VRRWGASVQDRRSSRARHGDANPIRPGRTSARRSTRNRGPSAPQFFRARWSLRWILLETARYDPPNVRRHRRREVSDRLGRR
jgi:hypothetical protein